jgi:PAS domain-containing protein
MAPVVTKKSQPAPRNSSANEAFADRVLRRQNEELFRMLPSSVGFSYVATLATLGMLYFTNDMVRGLYWFAFATGIFCLRCLAIWAFARRDELQIPQRTWSRMVIGANFLAGLQWGLLGTWLYAAEPASRAMFTAVVLVGYIGGAAITFSPVRFAHAALAIPAILPPIIYVFFMRADGNLLVGGMSLFMLCAILYLAHVQYGSIKRRITLEIENDALVRRISEHNTTLGQDVDRLRHQTEVAKRGQLDSRRQLSVLARHVEQTLLPVIECDDKTRVLSWNAAAQSAFGYRANSFGDRPLSEIVVPMDAKLTWDAVVQRVCEGRQPAHVDVMVTCADSRRRVERFYVTPIVIDGFATTRVAIIAVEHTKIA